MACMMSMSCRTLVFNNQISMSYLYPFQTGDGRGHPGPTRTYTSDPDPSGRDARDDSDKERRPQCPQLEGENTEREKIIRHCQP